MGSYYNDIYLKRLNRYGTTTAERIQNERERLFECFLETSSSKITFTYSGQTCEGILEKYKQDETETLCYLLTKVSLNLPGGTVLQLPNKTGSSALDAHWMVLYLEQIKSSGYNRYIILKMSHYLTWQDRDKNTRNSWAFFHGAADSVLSDFIQSKDTRPVYKEDESKCVLVMPLNQYMKKDIYLTIGEEPYTLGYNVVGLSIHATLGVMYVTIDPVPLRTEQVVPQKEPGADDKDYYWFGGNN